MVAFVLFVGAPKDETTCQSTTSANEFAKFSGDVWRLPAWERGRPPKRVLLAQRERLRCSAGPGHRRASRERWRADKAAYFDHRERMLFRQRVTPYYGCTKFGICGWWAIPAYIVSCESGGDWTPDYGLTFGGAYGILVSTWHAYGGGEFASQANYAAPDHQSIIAHRIWNDVGPSAWACA
jgi:Transglycosylase-like domain